MSNTKDNGAPATPAVAEKAEVVDRAPGIALPDERLVKEYVGALQGAVETDPEKIMDDIAARILGAESADDVLAPTAVEHAGDLIGIPLRIEAVKVNQSDFDDGPGVYAIIRAEEIETGRVTTFSCGGRTVLAQVYRLAQLGALPADVVIVKSTKPTKQGYWPLALEAYGKRDKVSAAVGRAGEGAS